MSETASLLESADCMAEYRFFSDIAAGYTLF